jgi:ribosomal protein L11 methyltransferase
LGIAAIALGAHKAIGVDIDPKALQAATHNAHINGVEQCFEVVPADQFDINHAGLKAEVVIANILIGALLALRQRLTDLVASGGVLVLSGLLENQVEQIEASYGDDFEFDRFQQQEWIVLIGTGRQRG